MIPVGSIVLLLWGILNNVAFVMNVYLTSWVGKKYEKKTSYAWLHSSMTNMMINFLQNALEKQPIACSLVVSCAGLVRCVGMDKYIHLALDNGCNYLCMPGLKLIYVNKRGPRWMIKASWFSDELIKSLITVMSLVQIMAFCQSRGLDANHVIIMHRKWISNTNEN